MQGEYQTSNEGGDHAPATYKVQIVVVKEALKDGDNVTTKEEFKLKKKS